MDGKQWEINDGIDDTFELGIQLDPLLDGGFLTIDGQF